MRFIVQVEGPEKKPTRFNPKVTGCKTNFLTCGMIH